MGIIYLVRHGQANSGAKSEADYDRLSELGHQQAAYLGAWLTAHDAPFDHVISGDMRRHRETAEGMDVTPAAFDPRLNEMNYFALIDDQTTLHGVAAPTASEDWATHIPRTLRAWHDATIHGAEPFADFEGRIMAALSEAAQKGKRTLIVTSGGVIASVMRQVLGLSSEQMGHVLLPIYNSSVHRFHLRDDGLYLDAFNTTPHLDTADRAVMRSYL